MRTIRPGDYDQLRRMKRIGDDLRLALEEAKLCEAPRLAAKLRSAIKSQGGALRHLENRILRTSQK